jgi:hypothetical protein
MQSNQKQFKNAGDFLGRHVIIAQICVCDQAGILQHNIVIKSKQKRYLICANTQIQLLKETQDL